ncbi:response regulator [Hyalangium rubrum]|uniref:Response regulator n=1 Tax=Hyalangium rubrum TaxID=3103134 RepID=A0ABU5HA69_9BACT|nr:response regulator [Hyalangium sp. s54d21]MDY7230201.1 response regulator [Hyalangium sp. s54d21]
MKTLLLIDEDRNAQAQVQEAFASDSEFSVVPVATYEEALWGLEEYPVGLVLVSLGLRERQGFQVLMYLANCYPEVPVMVMSEPWEPHDELPVLPWVGHLRKPLRAQALAARVRDYLQSLQRRDRRSLSLQDFLQILGLERETCLLSVGAERHSGEFHLFQGEVVHATCGAAEGEAAVREMLEWEHVWLRMRQLPAELRLTLPTRLSKLLVEVEPALNEGMAPSAPLPEPKAYAGARYRTRREGAVSRAATWVERWLSGWRVGLPDSGQ